MSDVTVTGGASGLAQEITVGRHRLVSDEPVAIPRVFGNRPVAVTGATPGAGGTRLAQAAWLPVLRALGTRPWFGKQLHVANAGQVFDAGGKLVDEKVRRLLAEFVAGFAEYVKAAA